jgi:hypothetical protein
LKILLSTFTLSASQLLFFFAGAQYVIKPKLGMSISRMKQPPPDFWGYSSHQANKIGFQTGVGIEYDLNPFFSVESGLLYTQKGLKDTTTRGGRFLNSYDKGYTYRLHYVEVPLFLHFKVDNHLKLGTGASISYLVRVQYFLGGEKKNNSNIDYSNFDFGLLADASWTVKRWEAGARFTYGISQVKSTRKTYDPEFPTENAGVIGKNKTFQFYINYLIKK